MSEKLLITMIIQKPGSLCPLKAPAEQCQGIIESSLSVLSAEYMADRVQDLLFSLVVIPAFKTQ